MSDRILFESHSHTPLCKHAFGEPSEYADVALRRGLKGLIVTCHNPMPNGFSAGVRMGEDELDKYIDLVAATTDQFAGRLDVRLGLEADYFEGMESYLENQLNSANFHFVLGSVHPQIAEFRARYWQGDLLEVQRTYFGLLAKTAETGLFDSISHPDLIKNFTAEVWRPELIMDEICRTLDRIAACGVAMELNTSGINKTIPEFNPMPSMLREMAARQIPITLGSDAHVPERVADGYETALELLRECGFTHVNYFLERNRHEVAIEAALGSLVVCQF